MAVQYDLPTIYQGADYELTLNVADPDPNLTVELSDADFRMHIRYGIDEKMMLNCTSFISLVDGKPTLRIPGTATTPIRPVLKGDDTIEGVYDLEMVSGTGKVYRLYYGAVQVSREVTR